MSRSDSKTIYILCKYSRAIFKDRNESQLCQEASQRPGNFEWQHYSQPNLRLLVEHSRSASASGTGDSIRLRVVCTIERGNKTMTMNGKSPIENIVLEDLDLVVVRRHIHPFPIHGLPLKAVYRGNMVGIRYLPSQAKSNTEYRRFQMNFVSSGDADALIHIIQDVCPCKPNPAIASNSPTQQIIVRQDSVYTQPNLKLTLENSNNLHNDVNNDSLRTPEQSNQQLTQFQFSPKTNYDELPIEFSAPTIQDHTLMTSSDPILPMLPQRTHLHYTSNDLVLPSSYSTQDNSQLARPDTIKKQSCRGPVSKPKPTNRDAEPRLITTLPTSRLATNGYPLLTPPPSRSQRQNVTNFGDLTPAPTQSTSRANGQSQIDLAPLQASGSTQTRIDTSTSPANPPTSSTLGVTPSEQSALARKLPESFLYEPPTLSHLSHQELENLVSGIIREEGFTELLEGIDSLWQLKGLVNM